MYSELSGIFVDESKTGESIFVCHSTQMGECTHGSKGQSVCAITALLDLVL